MAGINPVKRGNVGNIKSSYGKLKEREGLRDSFEKSLPADEWKVNLDHLNDLKETMTVSDGKKLSIWAIYAEPTVPGDRLSPYKHLGDDDEGLSCVDDVARAAVVYLRHYKNNKDEKSLKLAKEALDFVMYMQADDGEFYNFVFPDGTVNTDGHTSYKSFSHWAVEGLWGLCEGYSVFKDADPLYAEKLDEHIKRALPNLDPKNPDSPLAHYGEYRDVSGHSVPAWLIGDGTDQTSIGVAGLCKYYEAKPDKEVGDIIEKLCDGIADMRGEKPDEFPFGAHLSSLAPNHWHAWGSRQMIALADAGRLLKREDFIKSAEGEANSWIAHLNSSTGMLFGMGPSPVFYPHQAYGNEVLTEGLLSLYEATGKEVYAKQAGLMASWLMGNNPSGEAVYDGRTGRVFDGVDKNGLNFNAGAESTICGLIELIDVLENPVARKYLDYKEIDGHTYNVVEGENGQALKGDVPLVLKAEGVEGGIYSNNGFAELDGGDILSMDFSLSRPGEYIPYIVYTEGPASEGQFNISLDGKPLADFDSAFNKDKILKTGKLPLIKLEEGKHRLKVAFEGKAGENKTNLDSVIMQPAVENRFFENSEGKKLGFFKSFKGEKEDVKFSWPGSSEETHLTICSYDGEGNLVEKKEAEPGRENSSLEFLLSPYGYSIIEEN